MKLKFIHFNFVLFLLIFPVLVYAQSVDEKLKGIENYAEQARKDWNVPGMAMAIVKDNKVIFARGFGVREINKPEKVNEHTLFAIASNSKAFTTASLAMLVDEGKIKWDDKVSKYLPEFQLYDAYVTREMTVRDLVSHRIGLGTFSGDLLWYETNYSADEILKRARFLKPTTSFRSAYGYQNLMFIAAGQIIERASGMTWAQFVQTKILTPLGMNDTKTSIRQFKSGDNIAVPHNTLNDKLRVVHYGNVDAAGAAAGLNASVADLTKWMRLQLNHGTFEGKKIFSEKQSWQMWQPNVAIPLSEASVKFNPTRHFYDYGMGWFLSDYQGRKLISHSGGLDGMISQTALMPEENLGVVILTNSESSLSGALVYKVLDTMLDVTPKRDWSAEYLERTNKNLQAEREEQKKLEAARIPNTKPSLALADYAGTYSGDLYGDVNITEENGHLVMRMKPSPAFVADLEHWHFDTFRIKWRDTVGYVFPTGFVTFTLNPEGKTDELKIDQPNNDFWFYELELKRQK